ncbi:hypothetical protein HPB47_022428 [Ixodes persulcatus]|uniref:Uncharacterized protein n=1 Tax=Ixodes persulcatus TaxID=34615 RepID=A0AC60Q9Q1_IXOPE|nr:hypothetical protein HPB47_022428 [Ixodes persulcatus]
MEEMSTEALLFSSRTGYDPDKVAFESINPAARPLYTDGIHKTASEEQVGTLPGNSWVQVLHRKKTQKKEFHDQRKEDRGPTGGATEVKKKETKKPFRLPSLRELKHKIIVKPRKTAVDLKSCRDQIGEAVQNALPRGLSENSVVRLLEEQNTIMICTDIWDEAEALAKLRGLIFPSGQLDVEAYNISPRDEACRGVILGVRPELSNAQIKEITKAPGHEILDARRLGRSKSALVTFAGTKVPFTVMFNWLETPCFLYKKTKAACLNCGEAGHRTDVCSKPTGYACAMCGAAQAMEGHPCVPKCALCGGRTKHTTVTALRSFSRRRDKLREPDGAVRGTATENSRGMGRKQASLSLRLSLETDPPAVILLQEPGKKPVKIKDYRTVGGTPYFTTLVHRTFAATERDLDGGGVECGYVVIVPVKKGDRGIHIVNLYGNPKLHKVDYRTLLRSALKRMASTKNGAWLMDKLGMAVPGGTRTGTVPDHELSAEIRKKIVVSRIPRNMQPGKDDGRRKARSEALSKTWDHKEGTLYADCGGPVNGVATIAVANAQGRVLRLASVRVESDEQAEKAAIALAVVCNPRATVISDSQKACGNFARGMVCAVAERILSKTEVQGVHLIWSPGHTGNTGNEAANSAARGCILRDSSQSGGQVDVDLSFKEALKTKKLDRRVFPSPCGGLGKEEEWTLRRLQTGTLVTPAKLHQWYPDRYTTGTCLFCGDP